MAEKKNSANAQTAPKGQFDLAIVKKGVVDVVTSKVTEFIKNGELVLPQDYSPENALKAAWLVLQDTTDKDRRPVLQACTPNSISLALLDMIVLGLNPLKKQCYFIAYGQNLACQPSYFGSMMLAKRLDPTVADFAYEVYYDGDDLEYEIVKGKKVITSHKQKLENVANEKIKAAYCMALDKDGNVLKTELMTMEEIKQAWRQSKMNPVLDNGQIKKGSTHEKFTRDMALKTVINKVCKPIINASSDKNLLLKQAASRSKEIEAEVELEQEIAVNANTGEIIDVEPPSEVDTQDALQEAMVSCPDNDGDKMKASYCNTECRTRKGCSAWDDIKPVQLRENATVAPPDPGF